VLAVGSAFWPALLAVDLIALRAPHPARLLASFLAAGLLTTVAVGLVVIEVLQETSVVSGSRGSLRPGVALVGGAVALAAACLLERRRRRARPARPEERAPPGWMQRGLERGTAAAFVVGIVLNVFPGVLPFVALGHVAELGHGLAGTTLLLIAFYLVMFTLIEVPLVAYLVAPDSTAARTARVNAWLDRHAAALAVLALGACGAYLVVRGLVGLRS
jgi:hypothetical protein